MKSKTHGKPVKTFVPYKSAAALLLLAALAAAVAIFISGGTDTVRAFTLGERITDLEFDLHNNNANAGGIAAEGGHLYAADRTGDKMYAYRKSPSDLSTHGDHSSSLDFDLHSSNQDPWGVWNHQGHLYVLDDDDRQVYVYRLDEDNSNNHGDRVTSREFTLDSTNADGRGIWSNGTTVWVVDQDDDKLYAYTLSNGNRDSGRDIDLLGNNDDPSAIWSDRTTMWVLDWVDLHVYAYDLSDGTAQTGKEFALHSDNTLPRGFWGDGSTLWVSDHGMDKVFAYDVDRANQYLHLNSDVNEEHVRGVAGTGDRFYLSNSFDPDTVQVFDRSDNSYESGETFETHANNNAVRGLWTDGTHIWVLQGGSRTLYAYDASDGSYVSASSLTLDSDNESPLDIWGTDDRFFVLDVDDDHIYAYNRSTSLRVTGEGFDLHADNDDPTGIASDGSTLWVTDDDDLLMYAYRLTGSQKGERRPDKEFKLHRFNNDPGGAWFGGKYIHVIETDNKYAPLHRYDVEDLLDPEVTLVLSARAVSENGGAATVTAFLDKESDQATIITVSESSDAVTLAGTTLTIAANSNISGSVIIRGVDDDVFTGNRFVAVSGTAVNTDGVTGPADVRLVVRDDETVPLETYSYDSALDFNGLTAAGNVFSQGIWSDGTTIWVSDSSLDKLFAYRMNPGESDHGNRETSKEFGLDSNVRGSKTGVWSDGATLWVSDWETDKLHAYRMNPGGSGHGSPQPGRDIALNSGNGVSQGFWSDGATVWVADSSANKVFAYKMHPGETDHGQRETGKEFNLDANNTDAQGVWSDGTTIWVGDSGDDKLFAYTLSDGSRAAGKDLDLHSDNSSPTGIFADGTALWVADLDEDKLFAYGRMPEVTLELSARAISENGGTVTVTATLDKESTQETTITVSESSDAVTLTGTTLTIAANSTTSSGSVVLTGVDDDVFTGNRFVAVSGTAVNTDGVAGPADVRLVVRDDETVPLHNMARNSALDFTGLDTATNTVPYGVWSDGTTMWVVDTEDHKLYAYRMNPGQADHGNRDSAKEFDLDARNTHPNDIWSDGDTLWVGDAQVNKLFAYRMNPGEADHGSREPGKDIALHRDNGLNYGLWSDGVTVWVADDGANEKMFAYKMNPGGTGHGDRESAKEFNLDAGNSNPFSIWSDGETIWVADGTADKLFAYTLSGGSRVAGKDLALGGENANLSGIFANGTTLWVADAQDSKIYAYSRLPRVTLELSARAVSENGGTVTVTATLDRASTQETTITVSEDSDAVTLTGTTLTIAANATATTDTVTLTGVDDDVFTGNRFVGISGSAVNTDGVTQPADVRLVVRDDETVPVETYSYNSALDFTGLDAATNPSPWGTWSGGTTMWVSDPVDDKLYAYRMNPGEADHGNRDTAKEFDLHTDNTLAYGIWSDGATIWTVQVDSSENKLFAYRMNPDGSGHGDREAGKEFSLHSDNNNPATIWSDGVTIWVSDLQDAHIYAYRMNPGQSDHGQRDSAKEFDLHADNTLPTGIWSDGETIWVASGAALKLFAYDLSDGSRMAARDLVLHSNNANPTALFSDGTALWVANTSTPKIFAYSRPPTAILELSNRAVSENGGTATVTATLDMESTHETTITVSEDSDAVTLSGSATLTIAAGQTATTDTVTLTGVDDDVFTGNRFAAVSGTAVNTAGVTQPTDVRLVVRDDETVPVHNMAPNSALDFTGLDTATNNRPWGIWSDGTTMWVVDNIDTKLYAYKVNPGEGDHGDRDTAKEFDLDADNFNPNDIWSDGVTIWVADSDADKLFAYRMNPGETDHGSREPGKDITLHSDNGDAFGLWSDGVTIWVANDNPDKVFAYKMHPGGTGHGQRETGKEFDLDAGNFDPYSLWADGETLWVTDDTADKLFAYTLSSGTRDRDKEFALHSGNSRPRGIFSDGTTLWVAESGTNDKIFAYSLLPTVTLAVSPTAISENGGTATVTATLDMESTHATTITVSESSADVTQAGTTLTIAAGQTASSGSVVLTGVDNTNEDGSRQVAISGSAVNSYGILGPADIMLTVTDDDRPNNAPVVSNPVGDRTADVGQLFSIDVSRIFTDPDNDPLTFSVTLGGGLDQWLEFDTTRLILSGTPLIDHLGSGQVSITATDVGSATATDTFQVTVIEAHFDAVTLVSNLGQAPCANGRSVCDLNPQVGYVIPAGTQRAVEFTTGREGATLNQVVANFQNRRQWDGNGPEPTSFSAPTLELWSHHVEVINAQLGLKQTSPGALLATFASSRLPDAGNFEYRLTDPYQLQANTTYWLIFGCDDYCPFPVSRTTSDREDRGGMSGWTIANDGRLLSGADSGWGSPSAVIKVELNRFEYLAPELVPYHGDTLPHRPGIDPLTDFDHGTTGASSIGLRFNQALDSSSVPATTDFILRYRGPQPPAACGCSDAVNDVSISSVSVSGDEVRLNLNRYVAYYGLFSLEYRPGTNPLRSASRQINVARFSEPYVGWRDDVSEIDFAELEVDVDENAGRQTVTFERISTRSTPVGVETYALLSVEDADRNRLLLRNDYISLSSDLVTIPAFSNTVEVPLTIRDDQVVEDGTQRVYLLIKHSPRNDNLRGLRGTSRINVNSEQEWRITDDDETLVKVANAVRKTVSGQTRYVASYTAREGQEIEIFLILDPKPVSTSITVDLTMDGDSTANGDDFDWKGVSSSATKAGVRFDPLTRRAAATLQVLADTDDGEGDETLLFRLDGSGLAINSLSTADNHYVEVTIRDLPAAPANLTATAGTNSITLNWDAVTGATRYNVLRRTADQTTFSRIASPTTNTYVDRGARVDVTYHYQVQATSVAGTSPSSAEASAVILPPLPPAPTGFKATVEEGPQVALSWNAVSDRYLTGYRVSRGGTELALLDTRTREYTDTGVSVGTTYGYTVVGVNSAGDGPSATVSIEVTAIVDGVRTPGNLRAEAASDGITLHWDGVDNAMRYRVHRKGPGDTAHEDFMSTSVTTFRDTRVTAGETYSYKVQAQDWDFNKGALSDAVQATVPHPLHPPRNFKAELDASNSKTVNLTWDAPTSGGNTLTGYKLFRAESYNDFTQLGGTFSTTDTGHTDNGTSWDRAHEYRLIAIYSGNRESEPARVTIRTPRQPPWKVSGLTVTTDGATVTLTWDREGSGRATGYTVFRKSAHGTEAIDQYTKIADVSGRDTTTYQDDTVTSGQGYAYRVVATNNGQDGTPSDNVDVTVEVPP